MAKSAAIFLGIVLYATFMKRFALRTLLFWNTLVMAANHGVMLLFIQKYHQPYIPDHVFLIVL